MGPVWGGPDPPSEVRTLLFAIDGQNAAEYKQFVINSVLPLVEAEMNDNFFKNTMHLTNYTPAKIQAEFVVSGKEKKRRGNTGPLSECVSSRVH